LNRVYYIIDEKGDEKMRMGSNWKKVEDTENNIKNALFAEPLKFKELGRKTGLSDGTLAKWLPRLEKQYKVIRTVLPDKAGVHFKLIDKDFRTAKLFITGLQEFIISSNEMQITALEKEENIKISEDPNLQRNFLLNYFRLVGEGFFYLAFNKEKFGDAYQWMMFEMIFYLEDAVETFNKITNHQVITPYISEELDKRYKTAKEYVDKTKIDI
jgi:hypothetical protein